jgi:hypothetical protein
MRRQHRLQRSGGRGKASGGTGREGRATRGERVDGRGTGLAVAGGVRGSRGAGGDGEEY